MPHEHVSDDDLNRFLDGELTPDQRLNVQARLAENPDAAARVFAQAQLGEALRAAQPRRLFPPRASVARAQKLEGAFKRKRMFERLRNCAAALALVAAGWIGNSLLAPQPVEGQRADETFIFAAREALRVAQLDAGPQVGNELKSDKIERLVGAINISMPQLPAAWRVREVQVQPWNGRQSLVLTADTPSIGRITLVAAPMEGEQAIPPTSARDGRVPTVYWQSGGTAYALMGPATPERLEKEAAGIEIATRRAVTPKVRG